MDPDRIRAESEAYQAVGVMHVVAAPWRNDLDSWLRSMDQLAEIIGIPARSSGDSPR